MTRLNRILALAATLAVGLPLVAEAQGSTFAVDEALANRGKAVWAKSGCLGCHGFGKRGAGPDLVGVAERRSTEWLHRWLKDTKQMLESDSVAQALVADAKGVKMPQFKLTDQDIDALIHYLAREGKKRAGK